MSGRRVALLGGSFNPAHEGHLHISLEVLKQPDIAEIWWLVSPSNPLKNAADLVDYELRLKYAKQLVNHPKIKVLDFERKHNLQYSYDTICRLKQVYSDKNFIWLMGADNLASFHKWHRWRDIINLVPMIIVDRHPVSHGSLKSVAGNYILKLARLSGYNFRYMFIKLNHLSATNLRKQLGKNAFDNN